MTMKFLEEKRGPGLWGIGTGLSWTNIMDLKRRRTSALQTEMSA